MASKDTTPSNSERNSADCADVIKQELKQVNDAREDFMQQVASINSQISDTYEVMLSLMIKERDCLLQELNALKEKRLMEIQTRKDEVQHRLKMLQSFKKYGEELAEKGPECNIVRSRAAMDQVTKADELVKLRIAAETDKLSKYWVVFEKSNIKDIIDGRRLIGLLKDERLEPVLIAKSNIILDVKPWDDETDMMELEKCVRSIEMDGLLWGSSRLVPLAYTVNKLEISCVVEDDKVSVDDLEEKITCFEDYLFELYPCGRYKVWTSQQLIRSNDHTDVIKASNELTGLLPATQ